jgi:prophage regulatory protein
MTGQNGGENARKFLTDKLTASRYGISRPTLWRWVGNGNFPAPIKLSAGCTRWLLSDLEAWEADKKRGVA